MSDIYEKIYSIVRQIPKGRVSTYGNIAEYIGVRSGARMVGYAMNHAHNQAIYVPAHRVVNRNGLLTGKHHFAGENMMQELLEAEGLTIIDDKIQDFSNFIWNPTTELIKSDDLQL